MVTKKQKLKYPRFLDVELNTSCNLKCVKCPYKEYHLHPEFMELDLYKKIIDQIDWKPSIKLCQRGEPLLAPLLLDAIEYATKKGLETVINTNGMLLDKFGSKQLIKSGLNTLILSDYGFEEQYANGCIFSGMNQAFKKPVSFIVKTDTPKKWEGIADVIITPKYYDYLNKEENWTELPFWACDQLFEKLIIEPDGSCRCCCGAIHQQKYIGHVTIGLKSLWVNSILSYYRMVHSNGKSHELEMCRMCDYRNSFVKKG